MVRYRLSRPALAAAALAAALSAPAAAQRAAERGPWVELEVQRIGFDRNDIRKPNDAQGDLFSALPFTGDSANGVRLAAELPVTWWGSGHRLRLVYAPLSVEGTAAFAAPVRFQGTSFAAGVPTTLGYDFDTWRATYAVPLFGRDDPTAGWSWYAGGTLAIRDARIRLTQGGSVQTFDNVGLVPLLHLSTARAFGNGWAFEADLDGAPGPNGAGLWDLGARVRYALGPSVSVAAGLRHLRGGVDNDELLNEVESTAFTLSARYAF
jgi:hypothetical protein